jgi:serine/threonine protein phosphatase PrpC
MYKKYEKEMYIAPDPRDMWKNLPVTDYEGYKYPDEAQAFDGILDKRVVAASCRGRSHAHVGKPRDDNFYYLDDSQDSGWSFMAVADGAGSARYSRKGSDLACRSSIGRLAEQLKTEGAKKFFSEESLGAVLSGAANAGFAEAGERNFSSLDINDEFRKDLQIDKLIYASVYKAYSDIQDEMKTKRQSLGDDKITIKDYYTTLLLIAIKKISTGYFYISFWIGDGGIAICRPDKIQNSALVLGSPDSGEYSGQTRFLTMREEINEGKVSQRTFCGFLSSFESIILATDGVTDPYFPSEASVLSPQKWLDFWDRILRVGDGENPGAAGLFNPAAGGEEKAKSLRKWLDFWVKGEHDDRTILIVY